MPRLPVLPLEKCRKNPQHGHRGKIRTQRFKYQQNGGPCRKKRPAFYEAGQFLAYPGHAGRPAAGAVHPEGATLCRSHYEWYQHEILAKQVGVPEEQIAAVQTDPASPVFNDLEKAVLRYTDEVTQNVKSTDETFNELAQTLSHRELVELTMTIGFYNLVARILENTEVEIEN